ncbi:AraC family transcriptional regulator [Sphingomonas rosea]
MDTTLVPESEQFAYWAAHTRGARLSQPNPGPFYNRGDMWNLGALQMCLTEVDPFVAVRDRELVNAVDADYIQYVQILDGSMTFEADDGKSVLHPPACFLRDAAQPSVVTSTRVRLLMLYFSRDFLEERAGPIDYQGPLKACPELDLLQEIACDMIAFFPFGKEKSAPLYAEILRDLTAAALRASGAAHRSTQSPLLVAAKDYIASQPPGTLSVEGITNALKVSRSVVYRLFEREGGLLAYDRMRRLRALHRAMRNPLNNSTLAELSARYGFRDQTSLLRNFRKAFGYSPSELRRRNLGRAKTHADASAPDRIREAFDSID